MRLVQLGIEPLVAAGQDLHAAVGAGGVVDGDPGGENDVGRGLEVGAVLMPGDFGVPVLLLAERPFDLEVGAPEDEVGAEDGGGAFDQIGVAEQLVDAAVVEVAVMEVVAFGQALGPARLENIRVDGAADFGHFVLGDEGERAEPALLVVEADLVFGEGWVVSHGGRFTHSSGKRAARRLLALI